jgi:hypothetical protein
MVQCPNFGVGRADIWWCASDKSGNCVIGHRTEYRGQEDLGGMKKKDGKSDDYVS